MTPAGAQVRDSVNVRIPREIWGAIKERARHDERTVQATTTRLLRAALEEPTR